MPKRKLLITAMSMNIGGAEKSLVNLLNLLDYNAYDVDLLLFQRRGDFLPQVPAQVNVISVSEIDALYGIEPRDEGRAQGMALPGDVRDAHRREAVRSTSPAALAEVLLGAHP